MREYPSKKYRATIYRNAADRIFYREAQFLYSAMWYNRRDFVTDDFPEVLLFKNKNQIFKFGKLEQKQGRLTRIIALLFCEQMCLNPIK